MTDPFVVSTSAGIRSGTAVTLRRSPQFRQGRMSESAAQQRLAAVCRSAARALAADGAAVTLMAENGPGLAHATDRTADVLEREQQVCGEGPSLTAFALQAPVIVDDLHGVDARLGWPLLAQAMNNVDVGRFLALPVAIGGIRLGVLSIYSRLPGILFHGQLSAALLAADGAGLALLDAERPEDGAVPVSPLGPVLDYRIHQATGMIMEQTGLRARDALSRLRARAFREGVPLPRVAADVIHRRVRFGQESP
jgi:ANTAR domain/GAF domain